MGKIVDEQVLAARLKAIRVAKTPAEVLGVQDGAAQAAVRGAYLEACKQFHPNRFARVDAAARALALEVFIELKRAYEQLSGARGRGGFRAIGTNPGTPASAPAPLPQPAMLPQPPPSRALAWAAPPITTPSAPARPAAPVEPLRRAPTPRPGLDEALRKQRAREERVQKALVDSQAGRHGDARKELYAVAAEEPQERRWRVLLYLVWGHELAAEGKLDEALKQYERSLQLDAAHEPTKRAMAELETRRKGKGGGLWKSFFGK